MRNLMKKFKRSFHRLVTRILALMGMCYDSGTMTLVISGKKSIKIDLDFTPREVWVSLKEPSGVSVCHGNDDAFDTRIVPNGFVLTVTLGSEYREVEWIATK